MEAAAPEYVQHKDNRDLSHIPGSYGLPLLGNTFGFITAPFDSLDQAYQQYGPVFKSSLTFQRMVVALGPEFIQQLMLDSKQEFSARMGYDAPLGDFFAGLFVSAGRVEDKLGQVGGWKRAGSVTD